MISHSLFMRLEYCSKVCFRIPSALRGSVAGCPCVACGGRGSTVVALSPRTVQQDK